MLLAALAASALLYRVVFFFGNAVKRGDGVLSSHTRHNARVVCSAAVVEVVLPCRLDSKLGCVFLVLGVRHLDAVQSHFPGLQRGDWLWFLTSLRGMYFNIVAHNDFTLWGLPSISNREAAIRRLAADAVALLKVTAQG